MRRFFLFLKICVFVLVSTIHVRVRAGRVEEPQGCLHKNIECAVFNPSGVLVFKMQESEVRLSPGASIVRKGPNHLRVIRGNVLVRVKGGMKVESLFASLDVSDGGVLVEASDDLLKMTNLSADVRYRPRGHESDLELPKGLTNEVGLVTTSGLSMSGYPRTMSLKSLLEVWAKCFKKNEFNILKRDFETFLVHWKAGLDYVGPWYRETVSRELAEQEMEMERLRRLREAREKEERYYREMFRRKNFLD